MAYHPFRHLGLKFLSVAVAVGLWFTVAGEQTVERSLRVPLELTNTPNNLVQVEERTVPEKDPAPDKTVEIVRGQARERFFQVAH